ncbi:MAG: hypothetical protein IJ831_05925 [Spirochaetales bacterium]|nr:hypothetical protein [Spirochaetales bacterium]
MSRYEYGNPEARTVLVQMVGDHDLEEIEREFSLIKESTDREFLLLAIKVESWNDDLSPWKAPAVFGKDDFGGGAGDTLAEVLSLCTDRSRTYYIGGYSLAGLFALWASYQSDIFAGVAAASPSIWFPGFLDYMKEHEIRTERVYLSLGDREERTKNPVMATVGENIREAETLLHLRGIDCTLEWNQGNHFKDADRRTAKAFAWVLR